MKELEKTKEKWHHVATMEDLGGLNRKVKVVYDVEGVKMALDKGAEMVGKRIQVKGFRKGKAPKQLVEKMYPEEVKQFAGTLLAQEGFLHACYEQKISPLNEPKIEKTHFDLDGTFSCDILLEVKPSITPTGYLGMELQKPTIDKQQISKHLLKELKEQHMTTHTLDAIQDGSIIDVDFWVLVNSEEILSQKDQKFFIKKGQQPPFGENLFGIKRGEMASSKMILPENYGEHGGKEADVKIDVKMITEKVEPTDEELAQRTGHAWEQLMAHLDQNVDEVAKNQERQALEEQVVDNLIKLHDFDVPESWVEDEEKYLYSNLGLSNLDEKTTEYVRQAAERNVRRTFILEAIYDNEKQLSITQEEVDEFLTKEAERVNMSLVALKAELKKNGMADGVYAVLKHQKIMNLILSQAHIDEEHNIEMPEIPEDPMG